MLTQKVFGLPSVTDVVKGLLLQMDRDGMNLKQLCALVLLERTKSSHLSAI